MISVLKLNGDVSRIHNTGDVHPNIATIVFIARLLALTINGLFLTTLLFCSCSLHTNIAIAATLDTVKYLHKNLYKCVDRAMYTSEKSDVKMKHAKPKKHLRKAKVKHFSIADVIRTWKLFAISSIVKCNINLRTGFL